MKSISQAANAFFVAEDKFGFEKSNNSPFCDRPQTKLFGDGGLVEPGLFDHRQSESDGGDDRNRDSAECGGTALDVDNFGP